MTPETVVPRHGACLALRFKVSCNCGFRVRAEVFVCWFKPKLL